MLVLEHLKQIVAACDPQTAKEYRELWASIKPVKFGNTVSWSAAAQYALAQYQVPRDVHNLVLRVECYTINFTSGAADYGLYEPPPPGDAFWQYIPYGTGTTYNLTDPDAPAQLALDADEFLIFRGGYNATLIGDFSVAPDGATRLVRTLVYSYNCGSAVIDRIGSNQALIRAGT